MEVAWFGPQPRRFAEPLACFEAFDVADVVPTLARAEAALDDGYSVAGYLAYEAGAAFVAGQHGVAFASAPWPLVALGVYAPAATPGLAEDVLRDDAARLGPLVAHIDADGYAADLAAIAEALHAGDVYQVNYTVPFTFAFAGDPAALFARMRAHARVPFAAYVRHGDRALLSLSPERFFELDGTHIRTRPMKGTSAPDATASLDSPKNRAEHVMIVDLLRNDMHRICTSVDVAPLFGVETYPTFATMTSTLDGRLRDDARLGKIFAALFPCGSVTGAPKASAMAQIGRRELAPRGIAMGTIGYCDGPRRGQWNVAIRTASLDCATGRGEVRIGGGIVADSTPAAEWAEILVKRRVFADLAPSVRLIETLRVETDGACVREAVHRARLARSAFALGIAYDDTRIARAFVALRATTRHAPTLARIELAPDGGVTIAERALEAVPLDPTIALANSRVCASDPVTRYKTTIRDAYDAAGAEARALHCFDALLCNERGELADGARTSLFIEDADGTLLTPPLASGALAGILRGELLASGRAREVVLAPNDLSDARIYVGNAARGLIAVRLVSRGKAAYGDTSGLAIG